jgi:hypothetical protein
MTLILLAAAASDHYATADLAAVKVDRLEIATWALMAVAIPGAIWSVYRAGRGR